MARFFLQHRLALLLLPGLWACGAADPSPVDAGGLVADAGADVDAGGAVDASAAPDASGPTCEVGTGIDLFEPLLEDQLIPLSQGPQGGGRLSGYHIWSALKAEGVSPQGAMLNFQILMADTREVVARQSRTFTLEPNGSSYVAYGVAPRIDDCCVVRGQPIIMRAEITDQNGLSCAHERRLLAAPHCADLNGAEICP